jgi:SAM-dependent methyltransferase
MLKKALKNRTQDDVGIIKRDLKYWGRIASRYDEALSIDEDTVEPRSRLYEIYEDRVLDGIMDSHVNSGPTVFFEVGSGTGRYILRYACRIARDSKCRSQTYSPIYDNNLLAIIGLDFSFKMIETCLAKLKRANLINEMQSRILLINGLAEERSFSFDRVDGLEDAKRVVCCMFNTLGNIEPAGRRRKVLERIYDLIYPDGEAVISVFNRAVFNEEGIPYYSNEGVMKLIYPRDGTRLQFKRGEVRSDDFYSHWFKEQEIMRILHETGFRTVGEPIVGARLSEPDRIQAKRGIIIRARAGR